MVAILEQDTVIRHGRAFNWMESAFREPSAPKVFSAAAIPCRECGAGVNVVCRGSRFCSARMAAAMSLARSGQLAEVDPDRDVLVTADGVDGELKACMACRQRKTKRGQNNIACSEPHQCQTNTGGGRRCPRQRQPGSSWCTSHDTAKRWTNNAVR